MSIGSGGGVGKLASELEPTDIPEVVSSSSGIGLLTRM